MKDDSTTVLTPLGEVASSEAFTSPKEYQDSLAQLRAAAGAYYNSDSLEMDDATYDALARRIMVTELLNPDWVTATSTVTQVGAGVAAGGDVAHTAAMLSLDNVFSASELTTFLERVERTVGHPVAGWRVEPKLDGLAISARYVKGNLESLVTRGDGRTGEDVMHAAPIIKGLPTKLSSPETLEIRGEVMMTDADFETANQIRLANGEPPLVNPRNGAAGTLRAQSRSYVLPLSFFAYTLLEGGAEKRDQHAAMGFVASLGVSTSPGATLVTAHQQVHAAVATLLANRATMGIAIDGAVIKVDDLATRQEAGFTSRAPRWAIAYKYPADSRETELLGIEVGVGRTGNLSFTASLAPVEVGGVTVSSASVHNPTQILAKGLRVPDQTSAAPALQKVWVRRAGDVIPEITGPSSTPDTGTKAFTAPSACPTCGGALDTSGLIWRCLKGRNCAPEAVLSYAVSRDCLDIDAMGPSIVTTIVAAGLASCVTDLFELSESQLVTLDRVGPTLAKKIMANIDNARALPMNRVFCALGVTMTGRSMSRRLASHFGTMSALRNATLEDLQSIEGVGPERAASIFDEMLALAPELDYLAKNDIGQTEPVANPTASAAPLPLAGTTWVVTGTMTGPLAGKSRNEVHELLESLGAKVSSSVSKSTSTLLIGDNAGSKAQKATSLGVAVLTEKDFSDTYLV